MCGYVSSHREKRAFLQSLMPKSEKIYSPSVAMFLICGSFLHGPQRMFFSLKFSPAVEPVQCCAMEVAPCMIDLNVTPGHGSWLMNN